MELRPRPLKLGPSRRNCLFVLQCRLHSVKRLALLEVSLILWGNGASRANAVHWMLHELGLDYEKRLIGSRTGETQTPEFLCLNPAGKIPVLEDGDLLLTESAAINTYLALNYPTETSLVPLGPRQRAKYDQWCFFAMTELDAQSLYIVHKHTTLSYVYGEAPTAVEAAKQTFVRQAGVMSLAFDDGRSWIMGDEFSAADILLTNCLAWGHRYGLEISARLLEYLDRSTNRDAYKAARTAANPS